MRWPGHSGSWNGAAALREAWDVAGGAAQALLHAAAEKGRLQWALRKSAEVVRRNGARGLLDAVRERAGTDRAYPQWVSRFDRPGPRELAILRARAASLAPAPLVSVVLTSSASSSEEDVRRSLRSLDAQIHHRWELCTSAAAAAGEVVVPLAAGDELAPAALFALASELSCRPDAEVAYGDFDRLDREDRRCDPVFKPGWDRELIAWPGYLGRAAAFRKTVLGRRTHPAALDYGISNGSHVPYILCHARSQIVPERCSPAPQLFPPPRVSAIVPTRDGGVVLRRCVESLLSPATAYPDLEIIVVDNQSRDPGTLAFLEDLSRRGRARVVRFDRPFNFATINNDAARIATGSILLLLNDDVEARSPGWLHEMVWHATRREIGPVGARLLYPDGTIQHAGIVTGLFGMVGHIQRGARAERPAWMAERPRTVSAVTAAVLAIRRDLYRELDGLDEQLAVAFNDVDFCLRAERAGYRTLYTPGATLVHHESRTRGRDDTVEKRARFQRETDLLRTRWGQRLLDDPHYSPNLSLWSERARLAWPPRVARLWE